MRTLNALGNIELNKTQGYVLISLNPSIYSLENIRKAALNTPACIMLDGNPETEILVEIRGKSIDKLLTKFQKELLR